MSENNNAEMSLLPDNTEVYCYLIDAKGRFINANQEFKKELTGPCCIIDQKIFKNDILYLVVYNEKDFNTRASLIN